MLKIDGSFGEGGGQILRTSLALSIVTGTPVHLEKIRSRRKRGGLRAPHLAAVLAAGEVSGAKVEGAELGSEEITFTPGTVRGGGYRFDVGTAGSAVLVLQTILPALLTAEVPSEIEITGGTHNPQAPSFDFLARSYLPLIERMGPTVRAELLRHGFFPAGGGRLRVTIDPALELRGFDLLETGRVRRRAARVLLGELPLHIAEREIAVLKKRLGWPKNAFAIEEVPSDGPGNAVVLDEERDDSTAVFTAFGQIRVPAEKVAERAFKAYLRTRKAEVPVSELLADQLLLPLALAGGGSFKTLPFTSHATTQIEVMRRFLDVEIHAEPDGPRAVVVCIERR